VVSFIVLCGELGGYLGDAVCCVRGVGGETIYIILLGYTCGDLGCRYHAVRGVY
jgi:hypothetical protein